jgi:hypothetical protein
MNIVIAILSPGAMGSAISARLVKNGARVLTSLDGRSTATVDRARAAGMQDVSPETIATAGLILSIVPPGEAVALTKGLVTHLSESRHKPVYIDCNALSPKTKIEIAGTLAETGCDRTEGTEITEWRNPRTRRGGATTHTAGIVASPWANPPSPPAYRTVLSPGGSRCCRAPRRRARQ